MIETDYLVLGGGLCGLAAGSTLGEDAIVLEAEKRAGGLVRTECFDGYWFDRVLHFLHLGRPENHRQLQDLMGGTLTPCPPAADVVCEAGRAPYPLQLNLSALAPTVAERATRELLERARTAEPDASNYEDLLLQVFGPTLCEQFFFPYNRKQWKRPLRELSTQGFVWNLRRPTVDELLGGSDLDQERPLTYNSNGYYPRPAANSPVRGMEVLSRALAETVPNLVLRERVTGIDLGARTATTDGPDGTKLYRWRRACLSTLPVPKLAECCFDNNAAATEQRLLQVVRGLPYLGVASVAFRVSGPRTPDDALWTYYPDPAVPFTRLIRPHVFDPGCAPDDGWGLMAEVTLRHDEERPNEEELIRACLEGIERVGALGAGCTITGADVMWTACGYVVFEPGVIDAVQRFFDRLALDGVHSLGRYGGWKYGSMEHALFEGWEWANRVRNEAVSRHA